MNYETFDAQDDLKAFVKCYWILEVPLGETEAPKQRIVPDGCLEMIFTLGDDVRRYTSETSFIVQPRAMVLGQITEPFFVKPTGEVKSFAVRFYSYGFANFVSGSIHDLANRETPVSDLFGAEVAGSLEHRIVHAGNTSERVSIVEEFLISRLMDENVIDSIVKETVGAIVESEGSESIHSILRHDLSRRRQLERKFLSQVGISPKQLGKVVRLQTALKLLLSQRAGSLTEIAYESNYYDQAHFSKDFKEFTGISPKEFLTDDQMILSTLFYTKD